MKQVFYFTVPQSAVPSLHYPLHIQLHALNGNMQLEAYLYDIDSYQINIKNIINKKVCIIFKINMKNSI